MSHAGDRQHQKRNGNLADHGASPGRSAKKAGDAARRRPHPRSSTQGLERGPELIHEKFRLLEGGEMAALGSLAIMDELRIGAFRPAPGNRVELAGELAAGTRSLDSSPEERRVGKGGVGR